MLPQWLSEASQISPEHSILSPPLFASKAGVIEGVELGSLGQR